jgi:hypothetical protein
VAVEDGVGEMGLQAFDYWRTNGNVIDEVTVHHIDVKKSGTAVLGILHFEAKLGKIGGEYRRGDMNFHGISFLNFLAVVLRSLYIAVSL